MSQFSNEFLDRGKAGRPHTQRDSGVCRRVSDFPTKDDVANITWLQLADYSAGALSAFSFIALVADKPFVSLVAGCSALIALAGVFDLRERILQKRGEGEASVFAPLDAEGSWDFEDPSAYFSDATLREINAIGATLVPVDVAYPISEDGPVNFVATRRVK